MSISETAHVPVGLTVEIRDCPKYRGTLNGRRGVVVTGEYGDIRLRMHDLTNVNAESGDYYVARCYVFVPMADNKLMQLHKWLRMSPIEKSKTPQYKQEQTERTIIMMGNYRVAFATYVDNTDDAVEVSDMYSGAEMLEGNHKSYEFACFGEFAKGDTVLVKSGHHGYGVAVITGFRDKLPNDDQHIIREVLCLVDVRTHKTRLEMRRKAAELKEQMEQRAAELQDVMLYETLAASDTKMMELLTQFKSLT